MSGFVAERAAIENRWLDNWVTGSPSAARTPTQLEQQPFTPPASDPWVRLNVLRGEGLQISSGDPGNNTNRYAGVISIQIFAKAGLGAGTAEALADLAATVFRNQRFSGIFCRVPYISSTPPDEAEPWHQVNVTVPYWRDIQQ